MVDFADRFGYDQDLPPRNKLAEDSEDLRAALRALITVDGKPHLNAYKALCDYLKRLPDSNVWGEDYARENADNLLWQMHWTQTYGMLEHLYRTQKQRRAQIQDDTNRSLARSGLGYEMRDGLFEILDLEADEFEIRHNEDDAVSHLSGRFAPVRVQYGKALAKLRTVPADYEGALADALGSLEAVAKIIAGNTNGTLPDVLPRLFPEGMPYHAVLKAGMDKLYAYASKVPGARHGRYEDPQIAYLETVMVTRIVGAMIVFLIADDRTTVGT